MEGPHIGTRCRGSAEPTGIRGGLHTSAGAHNRRLMSERVVRCDFEPMERNRGDVIVQRESEAGGCRACGAGLSQWETGFDIDLVVEAILLHPALLEPLLVRRCRGCGTPYDWDVLIGSDDLERHRPEEEGRQAELLNALRTILRTPRVKPDEAAKRIRRGLGVTGIYVEDGTELERRLRRP